MNIFDLQATISLNGDAFMQGVEQAQGAFSGLGSSVGAGAVAVGTVVGNMATSAASSLVDFGKEAVQTGMAFDASMANVAAISGATGDTLDALRDKAKEMGGSTKFTATEAADAFSYMAMAGWDAEQMMSGIEGIMNLAAASGEDLATTSDIVTDALTAFGLTAEDSAHFADVLAAASSAANTDVGMMGETFKHVAPVAGALGYSVEDVGTAIGLMANSGVKGSRAGTALRAALSNLLDPSDKVADALKDIGLMQLADDTGEFTYDMEALNKEVVAVNKATEDYNKTAEKYGANSEQAAKKATKLAEAQQKLNLAMDEQKKDALTYNAAILESDGSMLSFADTVGTLRKAFSGLTESEKAEYASVIFGQEAMAGMLAIINSTDADVYKLSDTVYNSSIDMDTLTSAVSDSGVEWDKYSDKAWTVSDLVDEMAYNFIQAGTSVEDFIEYLNSEYDMDLDDAISAVEAFQSAAEDSAGTAQRMADIMNDNLPGAVTIMQSAFDGLKIAVYEKIKGPLQDAAESAKDVFERLTDAVKTGGITEAFSEIGNIISEFASEKFGQLTEALGPAGDVFQTIAGAVLNLAASFKEAASSKIEDFIDAIKGFAEGFDASGVASTLGEIGGAVMSLASAFASASADVISGVSSAVKGFLDSFGESDAAEAIGQVGEKAKSLLEAFLTASGDVISGIASSVKEFLEAFGESDVGQIIGTIAAAAADLFGDFLIAGQTVIQGVADGIKKFLDVFDETGAVAAIESVAGLVAELFAPFTAMLGETVKKVAEGFGDLATKLGEFAGHVTNDFVGLIKNLADNFEKWAPWVTAIATGLVTMQIVSSVAAGFQLLKAAFESGAVAANLMKVAQAALNAVMNAAGGPVGIVIGLIAALAAGLATAWATNEDFRNSVIALWDACVSGAQKAAEAIGKFFTEWIPEKFNDMLDWFKDLPQKFMDIGRNIVDGIKSGFTEKWNEFKDWVGDLTGGITDFVKGIFGVHSPSTVFAGIGQNLVLGLEQGWGNEFGTLEKQIGRDLESLTGDAKKISFADSALGRSSAAGISSLLAASDGGSGRDPVAVNLVLNGDTLATVLYDPLRRVAQQKGQNTREVAYA